MFGSDKFWPRSVGASARERGDVMPGEFQTQAWKSVETDAAGQVKWGGGVILAASEAVNTSD